MFVFLTISQFDSLDQWFSTEVPRHTRVPCQGFVQFSLSSTLRPILVSRHSDIVDQGCREAKKIDKH